MRIAVVDIGTNTTRLYLAEVDHGRVTQELSRTSLVTRLGAGVDASGHLAADALEREYAVLERYHDEIAQARPDVAVAVMTSAVRDAANGAEFAADVHDRFGLAAHVLTGDQEARLTYLGATDTLEQDPAADPTLVFDIGGGSTEVVIGHGDQLDFHVSTQAGVVRQADRHIATDPPTPAELDALARDVRAILDAAVPTQYRRRAGRAIAVAGTPTSLAAIAQGLEPYDPKRVHGYVLTAAKRDELLVRLAALPLEQRKQVPGLHPDRAIAILPGIVILKEVMDLFALDAVEISEHDILRGAAIHYSSR